MKKVCVVSCKDDPEYIRARTLWAAVEGMPDNELIVVRNTSKGLMRYPEVFWGVLKARIRYNPDVYVQTFRAYELLPWVRLVSFGKRLVVDEYINFIGWSAYEQQKFKPKSVVYWIFWAYYRFILILADHLLIDTDAHADFSANLMKLPRANYTAIPIATDEAVFHELPPKKQTKGPLEVFFYGHMLPLHGFDYILEAAQQLKSEPIQFTFAGGKGKVAEAVERVIQDGAKISYLPWVPFEEIPRRIEKSDICLAGPFGGTFQSKLVITTKTFQFFAAGRPTVVGETPYNTLFHDKQNCLLVPQADAKALADALRWALANRQKLSLIGANAAKTYHEELSIKAVREKLAPLL